MFYFEIKKKLILMELLVGLNALIAKEVHGKGRLTFVVISISDSKRLKKIKKQDMNALFDWFLERESKFYKIGWAYLKNHHDVEDVFHNTIIKVHDKIGQLKEDRYFETWVTSIFINECRAIYRKRKQQVMNSLEETTDSSPLETTVEILGDLDQLDEIHKEIILLKYLQGYSQKEIALILNLPVGTVKSRLYRGLMMLRKIIEGGEDSGL